MPERETLSPPTIIHQQQVHQQQHHRPSFTRLSQINSFSDPGTQNSEKISFRPFPKESSDSPSSMHIDSSTSQPQIEYRSAQSSSVRSCSVCGVTSTPRWRKGPRGRQSLCNSCGLKFIRKMKKEAKNREKREKHLLPQKWVSRDNDCE